MLGPSAGNSRCFKSVQGRSERPDLVSSMVSGDLTIAEDRGLAAARDAAIHPFAPSRTVLVALVLCRRVDSKLRSLSLLRYRGAPCTLTSLESTSMTREERMLPATSMARHSRVYSSITVKHFSCWPLAQASKTKSYAHRYGARCRQRARAAVRNPSPRPLSRHL